jgi:hypothetical protein
MLSIPKQPEMPQTKWKQRTQIAQNIPEFAVPSLNPKHRNSLNQTLQAAKLNYLEPKQSNPATRNI